MQTVVTIRSSHRDLQGVLAEFVKIDVRVVSVTKGSELGRVGFTYKWTVVLEGDKLYSEKMPQIDRIIKNAAKRSYWKTAAIFIGPLIILGVLVGVLFSAVL